MMTQEQKERRKKTEGKIMGKRGQRSGKAATQN